MISAVCQLSSLAGSAYGVRRPAQEHRDLRDIEWPSPVVLEHLWNKTAVHGRGPLVIVRSL